MYTKRNTIQRQLILDTIKELNTHATAEQIYDTVVQRHPSISKATVYRNLNQMVELAELLNIGTFYGSAHYDHNCHEHYHFVCEVCKRVFDVDGNFTGILDKVEDSEEYCIKSFRISFSGLCRDCTK